MSKDLCMLSDMLAALQPAKKTKKNDGEAAPKAAAKSDVDTSATNGSRTIFCKNLPWGATDEDLGGFFADCGEVTECRIGEPSLFLYLTLCLQAYSCAAMLLTVGVCFVAHMTKLSTVPLHILSVWLAVAACLYLFIPSMFLKFDDVVPTNKNLLPQGQTEFSFPSRSSISWLGLMLHHAPTQHVRD